MSHYGYKVIGGLRDYVILRLSYLLLLDLFSSNINFHPTTWSCGFCFHILLIPWMIATLYRLCVHVHVCLCVHVFMCGCVCVFMCVLMCVDVFMCMCARALSIHLTTSLYISRGGAFMKTSYLSDHCPPLQDAYKTLLWYPIWLHHLYENKAMELVVICGLATIQIWTVLPNTKVT